MDTALASALAAATRAANRPVAELCAEALAQHDAAQDAALAARRVPLEHLAASSAASRSALAAIHAALERFHTQLKSASEHIQQLQDKSISLSEQLDTRAHEEAVLAEWLGAAAVPPPVVRLVRETTPDVDVHAWARAVHGITMHLRMLNEYEAAHGTGGSGDSARAQAAAIAEQCKRAAIAKIRPHLLSLLRPLRTSVTTALPILQFSVLLPHNQPLYHFLALHAPRAAAEVQLAYVNAARLFYETAFRRYVRELRRILQRWNEPARPVAHAWRTSEIYAPERLQFASLAAAAPVLAHQSEDTSFRAAPEHLFHTLALVFLDTACSECAFLARFFAGVGMRELAAADAVMPAESMLSLRADEDGTVPATREAWRQVMEPVVAFFAEFRTALLATPQLPLLSLLTTATLAQTLLDTAAARRCLVPDLEAALMQHQLDVWPLVMRALDAEVEALRGVSVGAHTRSSGSTSGGFLERWGVVSSTDLARHDAPVALGQVRQPRRANTDPGRIRRAVHGRGPTEFAAA